MRKSVTEAKQWLSQKFPLSVTVTAKYQAYLLPHAITGCLEVLAACGVSEGKHMEVSIFVISGAVWESSQVGIEF